MKSIYLNNRLKTQATKSKIYPLDIQKINEAYVLSENALHFMNEKSFESHQSEEMTKRTSSLKSLIGKIQNISEQATKQKSKSAEQLSQETIAYTQAIQQHYMPTHTTVNIAKQIEAYELVKQTGKYISFDIETIGGTDNFGANRLDGITEIAYTMAHANNRQADEALKKTQSYFFGIDAETYKQLIEEVKKPGFATNSNRGKVIANRLAIYGDPNTQIKGNHILSEVEAGPAVPTVKQMIAGLDRLLAAGISNEATRTADGLTDGDRFIKQFQEVANHEDVVLSGHNIINFDLVKMSTQGIDVSKAKKLDTLAIVQAASKSLTTEELFKVAEDVQKGLPHKSTYTQENLVARLIGEQAEKLQAHDARVDSALHSLIVSHPLIENAIEHLKSEPVKAVEMGELIPYRSLVINKEASYGDFQSLTFLNLPTGETNTGKGYSFKKDKVKSNGFKPGILKKDTPYLFGGVHQVELSPQEQQAMKLIDSDYAQKQLYYAVYQPYGMEDTIQGSGQVVQLFKSKEHLERAINQQLHLAEVGPEGHLNLPQHPNARQRAEEELLEYDLTQPGKPEKLSLEAYLAKKIEQAKTDRAGRRIRQHQKADAEKALHLIDKVQAYSQQQGVTEEVTGVRLKDDLFNIEFKDRDPLIIKKGSAFLAKQLGKEPENVTYNELDNLLGLMPYAYLNQDTLRQVNQYVETHASNESQKKLAYQTIMTQLTDQATQAVPLKLSKEDLNYIEIDKQKLTTNLKAGKLVRTAEDLAPDYLRINLNGANEGPKVINRLLANKFGGREKQFSQANAELQGRVVLMDLIKALKIENLNPEDFEKTNDMADALLIYLREQKQNNPLYGIHRHTIQQGIEKGHQSIRENLAQKGLALPEVLEKAAQHVPTVKNLAQTDAGALSKEIVQRLHAPLSDHYFKDFGFEEKHSQFLNFTYRQFQKEQTDFYETVFKNLKDFENLGFIMDEKNMALTYGHQVYDLKQYLPQLKLHGDMPYVAVGNMEVALQGVVRYDAKTNKFGMATNFQRSVDQVPIGFKTAKRQIEEGVKNPAEVIERMFKQVNSYLRESPDIKLKNRMNHTQQFYVDMNDVLKTIPLLIERGEIQVTPNERAAIQKFADPNQTGHMGRITDQTDATTRNILRKYLNQATAVLFNNDAYEGNPIKMVAKEGVPYLSEKMASEGFLSIAPNLDAFGEYGPGNRITRFQNNFISFDVQQAEANLEALALKPQYHIDQGATSYYGYRKGVRQRFTRFQALDKQTSDQIVIKKLNITDKQFRTLIEEHFGKGASETYTDQQWEAIHTKMRQYGLNEDESIMDARLLESAFWQQNEVQKIRERRNEGNDFIKDKRFNEAHRQLDYQLTTDETGQVRFQYGGSIERKHNDPLFSLEGYHHTQSLTLASYDGALKKGIYAGEEHLMLSEEDVNYLIKDMSQEQAQTYIDSLDSYYYLDRKDKESYVKYILGNTEKTKGRSLTFAVGELDEGLKDLIPEHLIGSKESFPEIRARLKALGIEDEPLLQRLEREHYAVDIERNRALGHDGYGVITNENRVKHKGVDTYLRELFPSLRQYHMDTENLTASEAAEKVKENLAGTGFDFEVAEDGSMLFGNQAPDEKRSLTGLKQAVKTHYKDRIDPDILEEKVFDRQGRLVGTTGMINAARTKEYEIPISTRPIAFTDQFYDLTRKMEQVDHQIEARKAMVDQLLSHEAAQVDIQAPWYEEYVKLEQNIKRRRERLEQTVSAIEQEVNVTAETQKHLAQLNSCIQDEAEINAGIQKREKLAQEYSAKVNDASLSPAERKKYVTLSRENNKMLEHAKALKEEIADSKQTAMFVYTDTLNQHTKNKRIKQLAQAAAQFRYNGQADTEKMEQQTVTRLKRQIKSYEKAKRTLAEERRDFSSAYRLKNQGIVIDEQTYSRLRNKKITQTIFEHLKTTAPETIREQFGLTDENIVNRPIFSTLVNDLIEMGLKDSRYELLTPDKASSIVHDIYGDSPVAKGVLGVYEQSGQEALSVEVAEARYALSRMQHALAFNDHQKDSQYMKQIGFEEIDVRDYQNSYDYDAEFLKQGDSIFGKNLILNVEGEKIAVPYMPHSVYGETVVQKNQYESAITQLQNAVLDLDTLNPDEDKAAYSRAKERVATSVQEVKDTIHLVTAKGNSVAETVTRSRYDLGFMARSASYTGPLDADLTQAFYKGRSIADWQKDEVFINAGFTSREMFEEMGFFSNALKDQFKDGDLLFNEFEVNGRVTDEQLEAIYKKYGVSGLSGRFPYIQEMSLNAKQLYLSDSLSGNTIKNFIAEQKGKSSDNDGDYEAFMALKAKNLAGSYESAFAAQALGQDNAVLEEFNAAIGIDALGANKLRAQQMLAAQDKELDASAILEQAKVYDRVFFEGKLMGEQTVNPYFEDENFSIEAVRSKLTELETLTGPLDYDKPNEIALKIDQLDDSVDKEGYKKAIVQNFQVSAMDLAATAKAMKTSIGEVNLMMRDIDQGAEILSAHDFITERERKGIGEMSYAIQQESISPKNAKNGDINLDSIRDFKRIVSGARYNQTVNYNDKELTAQEALGEYLDATVKEKYLNKYAGTESPEYIAEMQAARQKIFSQMVSEEEKQALWKTESQALKESYYEESKAAMQHMINMLSTPEMQDVSAYNKLFTREGAVAQYANTERAYQGVTTFASKKDWIMQLPDDLGAAFGQEQVGDMLNPENSLYRHMLSSEEELIEAAAKAGVRHQATETLLENVGQEFRPTKAMAGVALAGVGAYLLMGAVGSSVTANTTNQAEIMQTTGDTLSDYGSDYQTDSTYTQPNRGYVVNINAKTSSGNVQKIAGHINQSISSSLNANLNLTMNVNELPLKQFQIDRLVQDSLFSH